MRKLLMAWALGACALGAQAQSTLKDDRSGEALLGCLVRPAKPPPYPADALAARRGGTYRAELTFRDAQRAPDVKVVFGAGSPALHEAAEEHARQFRLPCLPAGQRVSVLQEISFNPVDAGEVRAAAPLNLPLPPSAEHAACMRSPSKPPHLTSPVSTGRFAAAFGPGDKNGNVVLELSFTAPDQPPQAKVLYNSIGRDYRDQWLDFIAEYRVPCLKPGERFVTEQTMHLSFNDNPRVALKDVNLVQFLRMVKDVEAKPVNFDLGTMGCPFRLSFSVGRPALPNDVTEVGERNPNRRALIAWMEELELALKREQFESVLRSSMFIDVPCGTVKLG